MKKSLKSRIVTAASMVAVSVVALAGCSAPTSNMSDMKTSSSQEAIYDLNDSNTVELKKAVVSFGDNWTVKSDGVEIAEIKGQAFYVVGDTYAMYSNDGSFMGAESENFKVLKSTADVYNFKGDSSHRISHKMLNPFLYRFSLTDSRGNTIASLEQKIGASLKGEIKDSSGTVAWKFEKKLLSMGASITLEKVNESGVSALNAIWMVSVVNEIDEASKS